MTTHTPGPWREEFGFVYSSPLTGTIATVHNRADGTNVTPEEYKANARLIAQAPRMLEILERFDNGGNPHNAAFWHNFERDARAILRAVKGE